VRRFVVSAGHEESVVVLNFHQMSASLLVGGR
jgi:hypothetical protein